MLKDYQNFVSSFPKQFPKILLNIFFTMINRIEPNCIRRLLNYFIKIKLLKFFIQWIKNPL